MEINKEEKKQISKEYQAAFEMFSVENNYITVSQFATIVRSMNLNPTNLELNEISNYLKNNKMDFRQFCNIMNKTTRKVDMSDTFLRAFQVFDIHNTGYVTVSDIKNIMTTMGEFLTADEVNDLIKLATPTLDGKIDYKALTIKIFNDK